jgi:nicotinamidase-related amidase
MEQQGTNTALLVIDVQRGLFEKPTPLYRAQETLDNINSLVRRAHAAHVPVVYIQHSTDRNLVEGTDEWKLHPAMQPEPRDIMIRKHHGNAFEDTPLREKLEALHVGRVVITGLVSNGCVNATCIGAHALGYETILVKDAHSTYHENAAAVVEEYNAKLSGDGIVQLQATNEVVFEASGTH